MPTQTRFLYSILATLIFLLFSIIGIIFSSTGSLVSLSQKFQIHVCPSESSRRTPPITRKFQSLTPLLGTQAGAALPHDTDRSWESLLLPQNGGILKVRTDNNTITDYGISMFHQLHCLTVLRGLIFPESSQHHGASTSPSHSGDDHEDAVHWAHCFDYIAQAIICAADDTIEPPHPAINKDGNRILVIDGIGHTHQCRDPEPLWRAIGDSGSNPVDLSQVKDTVENSGFPLDEETTCQGDCSMPEPYQAERN
ncbi:hypothetical protein AlacWU_09767 [Aspergillus niger]|uniref:Contig An05c0050, genomic contig n=3 Tax=Aspergillus niger TaxID=5061 RepID=A2QKW9_ASPNC|nr:uncharacterized protein An05g01710 [Aspergillus niger]XP_025453633.1 uncharacterized protein BO96DRAFT_501155 [Aspergillus niger CBS 101883]RDH16553.1 hypothetical protein M747DRAFT_373499 [Aspergillus niger ATCC 13496]PYH55578.1 hypothetical protein BO96DRAFT_501155 [Aspergillus niger CBS 101883]CAK96506.1 unnamed protein product [Aspergillus niger]GJP96868.1 hypothetical protein AlacWU_09767 [Aspergillus niger]|eukprot:XP_001390742.1 hypothetical protein ANI_1_514044 [Aspergillus niger CBS 513.88]